MVCACINVWHLRGHLTVILRCCAKGDNQVVNVVWFQNYVLIRLLWPIAQIFPFQMNGDFAFPVFTYWRASHVNLLSVLVRSYLMATFFESDIIMIISCTLWFFLGCCRINWLEIDRVDFGHSVSIELWIKIVFSRNKGLNTG